MQVISLLIPFFRIGFCSTSLIFMLAYVWSKNFATQNVSLYGLLTVQVRHALSQYCSMRSDGFAACLSSASSKRRNIGLLQAFGPCHSVRDPV